MEKVIKILVLKTSTFRAELPRQSIVFGINHGTKTKITDVFEAANEQGGFVEDEVTDAIISICEWAGYPKRSYIKKFYAKYIPIAPLAQNNYLINGKVIGADKTTALIDAGQGLIFSIQNGLSRKKILKKGGTILVKGRLDIQKKTGMP